MDTPYVEIALGAVGSTQDEARRRYAGVPTLVTAAGQTAGRGRSGAAWIHADRAVAASLALAIDWPPAHHPVLALVAGLAAREAAGEVVGLKWPNDLMLGGAKVGGLLAESDGSLVTIGFGLNLFWRDPIEGATGLRSEDPGPLEADRLARIWARGLLRRAAAGPADWGRDEYAGVCVTLGEMISWEGGGRGRAVGIAADGGLEVETGSRRVILRAGAVREIRPTRPGTR